MSCENCSKGDLLPGDPTGAISTDGAYLASAPQSEMTPARAVVLLTDAFGLPLKNCKILADDLSKRLQCDVWVPDIFGGMFLHLCLPNDVQALIFGIAVGEPLFAVDALTPILPDRAGAKFSFLAILRFIFAVIPRLPVIFRNRPSVVDLRIASVCSFNSLRPAYQH
jgi:hypothetical protein